HLQALDVVGLTNAGTLRRDGAGEPGVGQHHNAGLVDLRLDLLHERRVVHTLRALVAAHKAGHQRRTEGPLLAAGVIERERRNIELPVDERVPLLVRLEERRARIDLHFELDVGGLGLASDDLHHLVAHVAAPARELVRCAQGCRGCKCGCGRAGAERQDDETKLEAGHTFPPQEISLRILSYITLAERSRPMSLSVLPSRPRSTSSVCSPSSGGAQRYSRGVSEKRIGLATMGKLAPAPCGSSMRVPRALTCGSANT